MSKNKWGYLRETKEKAIRDGLDPDTGLHRTGLEEYLAVIFPDTSDWIHDKSIKEINGLKCNYRPDYRSESLKLIVEFDGIFHYKNPKYYYEDPIKTRLFESGGYKVVRIPFFVQLTNQAVSELFGINVKEPLFDPTIPSMGIKGENTPAFMCPYGLKKMAEDMLRVPSQMIVNLEALNQYAQNSLEDSILSGYQILKEEIDKLTSKNISK